VNIKSGPNWGNARQITGMKRDFVTAQKTLRTSNSKMNIVAVNGCCYGKDKKPDKGEYFKYCGQEFGEFISGNSELYCTIIEPLGNEAKIRNDEFQKLYNQRMNRFVAEFVNERFLRFQRRNQLGKNRQIQFRKKPD
jgi:hypothetical protein